VFHLVQTLRFKLASLLLIVFGVILGGLCSAVLALREGYLREAFDERLTDRAEAIIDDIVTAAEANPGGKPENVFQRRVSRFRFPGYFIQVRLVEESVVARSLRLGENTLPLSDAARASSQSDRPALETVEDGVASALLGPGGELRLLTWHHVRAGEPRFCVQIAADLNRVNESVRNLRQVFLLVITVGLVATGIASWLLARRSLSPIARIAEIAERLRADDLTQRFEQPRGKDEVATMVATINRMLDRLAEAFQAQERFSADVAHELKTPLAILLGEAQVLMRQERSPEEYDRFVASVQDEVRALAQTVDSLLTLARAEAGLPITGGVDVPINEAVTEAVERCNPLAEQREVRVVPVLALGQSDEAGPMVSGDGALLRLMFANLLRNAIRHSPPEEVVDVSVAFSGEEVVISVRDRGPGIPREYEDKVFERFFRVPDRKASFQGTGLGLTIVRGIARLHGGSAGMSNHTGGGSEFVVRLPLAGGPGITPN
jgi:heavy metal sensor kinase